MQLFALLALFLAGSEAFNLRNIIKKPDVGFCLDGTENWLTGMCYNMLPEGHGMETGALTAERGLNEMENTHRTPQPHVPGARRT